MRFRLLFLFLFTVSSAFGAKNPVISIKALHSGDLIFENLDCGPLCDAIEAVTPAYEGEHFSHVGIIYKEKNQIMVIEAIGKNVHLTPIRKVLQRTTHPVYIGRLPNPDTFMIRKIIQFSLKQIGVPYDNDFLYNNGKYYCSELVYDAFKSANSGRPFFKLHPMTFKIPGSKNTFPVWIKYFSKIGIPIPEGKPGCNPGGIICSGKLNLFLLK